MLRAIYNYLWGEQPQSEPLKDCGISEQPDDESPPPEKRHRKLLFYPLREQNKIIYDPNGITDKCIIKQTTENLDSIGKAVGKCQAYDPNERCIIKQTTEDLDSIGKSVGKFRAYDPNGRCIIKQTTENLDSIGKRRLRQPSEGKFPVYDPNEKCKTCIRETTEGYYHIGNVKSKSVGKFPFMTQMTSPRHALGKQLRVTITDKRDNHSKSYSSGSNEPDYKTQV